MKIKTSLTLSQDLLQSIALLPEPYQNRSVFLETAAWAYLAQLRREAIHARDIEIINRRADYLNAEVMDALTYQVPE
jgi:metal-responsive CopG/Arc/MetJ family transcriptional regulator